MRYKSNVYEVEGKDLRQGKTKFSLIRAGNVSMAKSIFAKKGLQANPRFLKVTARKVGKNKYPQLPNKTGIY